MALRHRRARVEDRTNHVFRRNFWAAAVNIIAAPAPFNEAADDDLARFFRFGIPFGESSYQVKQTVVDLHVTVMRS